MLIECENQLLIKIDNVKMYKNINKINTAHKWTIVVGGKLGFICVR